MKITKEKFLQIFNEQFNKVDEELVAVLKGHLLIEKVLNQIIEDFVFHGKVLNEARLSFTQKIHVAKSMSLSDQNNSMWELVFAMNALRNAFAHDMASEKRNQRFENLKGLFEAESKGTDFEEIWNKGNVLGIAFTTSMIVGFLLSFHEEVERFKGIVNTLNTVINKK